MLKEMRFSCGSVIDEKYDYATNENLRCRDPMEKSYYAKFVDKNKHADMELPCYYCGESISDDSLDRYIEEKKNHAVVLPTCARDICRKNKKNKFKTQRKRTATIAFGGQKNLEKLKKKRLIKRLIEKQKPSAVKIMDEDTEEEEEDENMQMN